MLTALLPWPGVRLATLLLHVWLVLWVTGFVASFATRPHVIDQNGIRIRQGPLFDERIPWDAIVRVRAVLGSDDEQPNEVALAVSGSTDIAIDLVNPRTITFRGKQRAASVLRVGVDDPQRFLASIGRHRP